MFFSKYIPRIGAKRKIFALLDPDPLTRLNPDPIQIRNFAVIQSFGSGSRSWILMTKKFGKNLQLKKNVIFI
jgi:hypothetical protein